MSRARSLLVAAAAGLLLCHGLVARAAAYEAPDDCDWSPYEPEQGEGHPWIGLTCHLSAINSNEEKTNFSVISPGHTASLTVRCSSAQPGLVSSLEPAGFASLAQLRELVIDNCELSEVPGDAFRGLDELRSLRIRSSAPELRLARGALASMPKLESLDLSGNGLRRLPERELCHVPQLRRLNVSSNQLERLQEGSPCLLAHLDALDASGNRLAGLQPRGLDFGPALRELRLAANRLSRIGSGAFSGIERLEALDLGANRLAQLGSASFGGLGGLRALDLSDNGLVGLEAEAFVGLEKLAVLNVAGNQLRAVSALALRPVESSLEELLLSHNEVSLVPSLGSLRRLRVLRLDHNELERLPEELLGPLEALGELDLSHNRLAAFRPAALPAGLTHLRLSGNRLAELGDAVMRNASRVLVLDLSRNAFRAVPDALRHLRVLQTLDLSHNRIDSLEGASILELTSLWRLQLSHNRLENVTQGLLARLSALQVLDLSFNRISLIERGSLDSNTLLEAVRLDANELSTMDSLFHGLSRLSWLNVSDNALEEFDYAMLPRNLHWLDISRNRLRELSNYFDLTGEVSLSVLDASFNALAGLGPNSIPDSIETLLVHDNAIATIVPYTFFKKSRLAKVDLTVNSLRSLDRNALRLSAEAGVIQPEFFLGGNPIECDCDMVWFRAINSGGESGLQNYPLVRDLESLYCRLVYTREVSFVPLVEARPEQFLCPYETHCFALCKCCDFDACDCEMSCPDNCTCYHDSSWSKNIAVCSAADFTDLPAQLPMDATEIFLDGNNLSELGSHTFIGRKNLRALHLNHSQIHTIQNKTFNGLKSLAVLHLEANRLRELNGYEFETLSHLRELYLENNLLESVHNATFRFLRSLEVLHLQGNRLIDFPVWQLAFNPFLVSVKLAENLWACDCEFMERFRSWMSVYSAKIFDAEAVTCVSNEAAAAAQPDLRIIDFDVAGCGERRALAASSAVATSQTQHLLLSEDYLPLLAGGLATLALLLVALLALFAFRHTLRVWLHSKYGVRVFDSSFSSEDDLVEAGAHGQHGSLERASQASSTRKLFDLFVSYSPKDEVFVREVLASELEQPQQPQQGHRRSYKTCLYHRDLSGPYVADALVQATEVSRRSCVVLSQNFLASEWSRYDYKSGLHQALRSSVKKKLIVILLGDVDASHQLDPDLRLYLKTSVVLRWGDKLFWERLRYALPDAPLEDEPAAPAQMHPYATLKPEQPQQLQRHQVGLAHPGQQQAVSGVVAHHYQEQLLQQLRPSPVSSSASTSTNVSVVEDHYYHSPRYAVHQQMQPVQPSMAHMQQQQQQQQQQPQHLPNNGLVFLNNNLQVSTTASPAGGVRQLPQVPGPQQPQQVVMHI